MKNKTKLILSFIIISIGLSSCLGLKLSYKHKQGKLNIEAGIELETNAKEEAKW